jgi:cytochrome c-type biogenesis protein CcmH
MADQSTHRRAWRLLALQTWMAVCLWASGSMVHAGQAQPLAPDPALEARMMAIATELRCLVCQNQTVADSHSGLAIDLRQQIREQLQQGKSDQQVRDFMTARYGEFILYRPTVSASTALLWFGPGLIAILGLIFLWRLLRQRMQMPAELFDPETPETPDASKASTQ